MPLSRRLGSILWLPAIAALILNTQPDLILPAANSSLDAVSNALGLNFSGVTDQPGQNDVSIHCDTSVGQEYGHPGYMSCLDALREMPDGKNLQSFGNRGINVVGAKGLPSRYIGSDGDCIIDIDYVGAVGNTDRETYSQIWKTAETVMFDCVFMSRGTTHGGFAPGLGAQGKLTVTVQQYHPRVQCRSPIRPGRGLNATACQVLLDGMLATTTAHVFGLRGAPGVEVPLPMRFSSPNGDCSIALLTGGPPVLLTWHDIWGAAVAVAGMCIRFSKLGTAIVQSGRSRIDVAFGRGIAETADIVQA